MADRPSPPSPIPPSRDFGYSLAWLQDSPGARKLKRQERGFRRVRRQTRPRYAELHAISSFSFLDGASPPEDLIERAAELELPAVALTDRGGVYGAPRLHKAAKAAGIRALVGAEVVLDAAGFGRPKSRASRLDAVRKAADAERVTLLVESREGYRNLCRLLTAAARGRAKGEARASWGEVAEHAAGLWCLTGGDEGPLARRLAEGGPNGGMDAARGELERLAALFDGRIRVELQRHHRRDQEHRNRALRELADRQRIPLVATGGVAYARPQDKPLHDLLACLRHHTDVDAAGARLAVHRERYLKGAEEMAALFADLPEALAESVELASRLDFTLADLGYRFPDYPLPPDETAISYLREVTWNSARARFRPLTARAQTQIAHELAVIEKLELAGYFLIVWDLIRFCQREGILVQGRGSAANSAVCYALSITAVDPVKMELLFERFLSEERGEWPDIDLDLPSGAPRERVIQYVYRRYGPHGAAMTANVITYRDKLAAREVAKALAFAPEQVDKLAKRLGRFHYDVSRGDERQLDEELRAVGLDPEERRVRWLGHLWRRFQGQPRHLGQHSGGMVIAAGRLDEVVPLEPAAMQDRVVVQWDKDDCADLGIIKVDLLGLGMLNALADAVPMIRAKEGVHVDLAHLPADDPKVYKMMQTADTVGLFQVESRAQMASLPRNHPETFYDLVIQVAIIRPGPIVGGMVHPYFERRRGRQEVAYPHPELEPILKRTLGIPLFQEQLLRIAMVAAGFTGGEAEELRRAMGFKRSMERMKAIEERLRDGMTERGIVGAAQDQIVQAITSFALYGFPESHAASFALIAYASGYLKAHHPTAFYVSLLNAWPMGFYHPATLVQDAHRHGVEVRGIDVTVSDWRCTWEETLSRASDSGPSPPDGGRGWVRGADEGNPADLQRLNHRKRSTSEPTSHDPNDVWRGVPPHPRPFSPLRGEKGDRARGALRLGLRFLHGLRQEAGERIAAERRRAPFRSIEDLQTRCDLRGPELEALAFGGALAGLGLDRREALWQVARVRRPAGALFAADPDRAPSPLLEMSPLERTMADFLTAGITVGAHPMAYAREHLRRFDVVPTADLERLPPGRKVRFAGSVVVRQRPGTAKGLLFVTLEDETGMAQAMVSPDLLEKHREVVVGSPGLVIEGILQRKDGSTSVRAERFWPITRLAEVPSHDFR